MRKTALIGWLAALACAPALAQPAAPAPPADPIGELLARQAAALPDPEDPGQKPEPPPAPPRAGRIVTPEEQARTDAAYDSRIRASVASAQSFQGPLDGAWTVRGGDGDLFALQLVDRDGAVQGAWRDLRKSGALDASGFIDHVDRGAAEVTFRFADRTVALHDTPTGWTGELTEAGATRAVRLARRP